ncbi:hypothetical protein [Geobacillus sp. YHL]|uniref:hypothetical protein n=1 Tax=Geobacillus sp. YHL TaxID=2796117 RepID=UPI001EF0329D|nr:hypothetical protein [Geobacillus sp. YHL]MCG6793837.1 hypothetical protein [Geobacillus sp. YHL]
MMNKMQLLDKLKTVVENGDTEEIEKFLLSEEGEEIRRELEQIVSNIWEGVRKIVASLYKVFKENEELILSLIEEKKKD